MSNSQREDEQFFAHPDVAGHLDGLIGEVGKRGSGIQGVKGPDPDKVSRMDQVAEEISATRGRPLFFRYVGSGRGRGAHVELVDGSVKLDLINGIGINIMGHSHPEVIRASIKGAMSDVVMQETWSPIKSISISERSWVRTGESRKSLAPLLGVDLWLHGK